MRENITVKDLADQPASRTSKTTAECPEPPSTGECSCSDPSATSHSDEHDHDHDHGIQYIPTIVSLALLLSGILLSYIEVQWFDGYIKLIWFAAAYLPVGGKV